MLSLALVLFQYPASIRVVATLPGAELYPNPESGFVACGSSKLASPRPWVLISSVGAVVGRGNINAGFFLRGVGPDNRPVVAEGVKGPYGNWQADPRKPFLFGDISLDVRPDSPYYSLSGRLSGRVVNDSVAGFAVKGNSVAVVESGYSDRLVVLTGKGLVERREVRLTLRAKPICVYNRDVSVAFLDESRAAFFADSRSLPDEDRAATPLLGMRYVPPFCTTDDKCLVVANLKSGNCFPVLRVSHLRTDDDLPNIGTRSIACLGANALLLSHDDQLIRLGVDAKPH